MNNINKDFSYHTRDVGHLIPRFQIPVLFLGFFLGGVCVCVLIEGLLQGDLLVFFLFATSHIRGKTFFSAAPRA